jgi:hypothetical protein
VSLKMAKTLPLRTSEQDISPYRVVSD